MSYVIDILIFSESRYRFGVQTFLEFKGFQRESARFDSVSEEVIFTNISGLAKCASGKMLPGSYSEISPLQEDLRLSVAPIRGSASDYLLSCPFMFESGGCAIAGCSRLKSSIVCAIYTAVLPPSSFGSCLYPILGSRKSPVVVVGQKTS